MLQIHHHKADYTINNFFFKKTYKKLRYKWETLLNGGRDSHSICVQRLIYKEISERCSYVTSWDRYGIADVELDVITSWLVTFWLNSVWVNFQRNSPIVYQMSLSWDGDVLITRRTRNRYLPVMSVSGQV